MKCASLRGDRGVSTDPARPPFLLVLYQQYLTHQDSACFVREVSCLYTTGTLQRLARHACREVRRAAVLSLGFIGDYGANHTLGCACWTTTGRSARWPKTASAPFGPGREAKSERQELGAIIRLNAARLSHGSRRQGHEADRTGAMVRRSLASTRRRPCRPRTAGRIDSRLPSGARNQSVSFRRRNEHGPGLSATRQPGLGAGVFPPALRLNPDLEGVRAQVVRLTRMVEDSR